MAYRRLSFELPFVTRGAQGRRGFLGENNTDGETDLVYQRGFFRRLRNYHLGRGGLLKRQGIRAWSTAGPQRVSSGKIQGMGRREQNAVRQLVVACNNRLFWRGGNGWVDVSGSRRFIGQVRFDQFHRDQTTYLIGADETGVPFKWDGSGEVESIGPHYPFLGELAHPISANASELAFQSPPSRTLAANAELLIDDEVFRVTAVDVDGVTFDVDRGRGLTDAARHKQAAKVFLYEPVGRLNASLASDAEELVFAAAPSHDIEVGGELLIGDEVIEVLDPHDDGVTFDIHRGASAVDHAANARIYDHTLYTQRLDRPPLWARALAEYYGRVFALNTDAGDHVLAFSGDGTELTWPALNTIPTSSESEGMALARYQKALLVFHRNSVHQVYWFFSDSGYAQSYFASQPVDERRGCHAPDSVVVHRGSAYFADRDGIYEIYNLERPARHISRPLDWLWQTLPSEHLDKIVGFPLGDRGEVCFLVTSPTAVDESGAADGNHDMALVYNSEWARLFGKEAGWTVFRINTIALRPTAALRFAGDRNRVINLLGGQDGVIYEAWGDNEYSTGFTDLGQPVETVLRSGYLDFGRGDVEKGIRSFGFDILANTGQRYFAIEIYGEEERFAFLADNRQIGQNRPEEGRFDEAQFDAARFVGPLEPSEISFDLVGSARYFETSLTEQSTAEPHALLRLRWWFRPQRQVD